MSDPEARDAASFLKQLWQLPRSTRHLPVPNPVSILREGLPRLLEQDFLVSSKLDGIRFLLLMGRMEGSDSCYFYMVDRAYHLYKINVEVEAAYLQQLCSGTLLDGELVRDREGKLHYVVFDIVSSQGLDCTSMRYELRMQRVNEMVSKITIPECISCVAKPCYPLRQVRDLLHGIGTSPYPSDGLIFMPDRCPVRTGMHTGMFKWKSHHTIDFLLNCEHGKHQLYYSCEEGDRNAQELGITLDVDDLVNELDFPCIVECECCYVEGGKVKARIISSRPDKTSPNFKRTVVLTLQNIRENIKVDEILALIT